LAAEAASDAKSGGEVRRQRAGAKLSAFMTNLLQQAINCDDADRAARAPAGFEV
jgi:hypothetical protein